MPLKTLTLLFGLIATLPAWAGSVAIPPRCSVDEMKAAIRSYGSVKTSFYFVSNMWNNETKAHRLANFGSISTGDGYRDIVVIGWDDDFAAGNFVADGTTISSGAFKCTNETLGEFWISYEDTFFNRKGGTAESADPTPVMPTGFTLTADGFAFSVAEEAAHTYRVMATDSLQPINWYEVLKKTIKRGEVIEIPKAEKSQQFFKVERLD